MKRVYLEAIVNVADDFDLSDDVLELLVVDAATQFARAAEYTGQIEGENEQQWSDDEPRAKTCARKAGVFVAEPEGTFTCPDCTPDSVDIGDPSVSIWEERSFGWTAPCVCRACRITIPIHLREKDVDDDDCGPTRTPQQLH